MDVQRSAPNVVANSCGSARTGHGAYRHRTRNGEYVDTALRIRSIISSHLNQFNDAIEGMTISLKCR
jgi:hypothetical protein